MENGQYLIFCAANCYSAETIRKIIEFNKEVRSKAENGEADQEKSKDILAAKERKGDRLVNKWNRNRSTGNFAFTSLPSLGLCILDPS